MSHTCPSQTGAFRGNRAFASVRLRASADAQNHCVVPWLLAVVVGVALAGCGGGEPAALSGRIDYLGKPIADGGIRLFPLQGTPGRGAVVEIADSHYAFPLDKGLYAGRYRVEMFAARPTGRKIMPPEGEPGPREPVDEYVSHLPEIYGIASILKIDAQPGDNTRDFHLAKEGERQP